MSGGNKYSRGGGRGLGRMGPPHLGRGMIPLRPRGAGPGKEKGRSEEGPSKGRGLALKGSSAGAVSEGGTCQEETFQVVSCREKNRTPLYAMAIRLTPGLLETLKRVEELGDESTTMKFGVNASGHVIRVGEEEFPFSSAPEPGQLLDIFEEERRGDDGNGALVESGSVWRKLSVIRTLSASEKDRVKARSVEAERQQKSRKAIILDHSNSLMNNKVASSGDVNGRRAPPTKAKKEPPLKKRKMSTPNPVVPPVCSLKPRPLPPAAEKPPVSIVPTKLAKAVVASSPEPPLPVSSRGPPQVPLKGRSTVVEGVGGSAAAKSLAVSQKEKAPGFALVAGSEPGSMLKTAGVVNMTELRNCLIILLMDNPKGMTIKAVEKAFGEAKPNVRPDKKQIEKVIKAIASYHAPGKYMLKKGVEKGVFAKPSPGSGSSPETVPVDSPPLVDSPALMEIVPEILQETGAYAETGGDKSILSHQDLKKLDGTARSSTLPLQRGGENAVSRAIRKAGEMVRSNAERLHPAGQDKLRSIAESPVQKLEDLSLKESSVPQDIAEVDHVSIGGDESPVMDPPEHEDDGKPHEMEVELIEQDAQKLDSPNEVNHKKENSDGSDSSSSSASDSDSDTESESESESGSATGSGSDSESDGGSSSSASEEENMDEDVNIDSDDEDKAVVDVTDASKLKFKPKDSKTSLLRQENRAQKQASRIKDHPKKQKPKGIDVALTPHRSDDVDSGDGVEGGETSKVLGHERTEKMDQLGAVDSNIDVDIDVISCDVENLSPQEVGVSSPAELGKHNDSAIETLETFSHTEAMEDGKDVGKENVHSKIQHRSGSESDHSIEEYETRAENSGVRDARVKSMGDQKDETSEMVECVETLPSSRSKGSSVNKLMETPDSIRTDIRTEVGVLGTMVKEPIIPDVLVSTKEHSISGGVSVRHDTAQRREILDQVGLRTYREVPPKAKGPESKKKGVDSIRLSKNVEPGFDVHGPLQVANKFVESSSKSVKSSEPSMSISGVAEVRRKSSEGMEKLFKLGEESVLIGKGPDISELPASDRLLKSGQDGDTLERPDLQRKQNREAGLIGKPGKAPKFVGPSREFDQSSGWSREKDAGSGRDAKQLKKSFEKLDGVRKGDIPGRAGPSSELGEKAGKDIEIQRRLSKDGESWQKSPKDLEPISRMDTDNEIHSYRSKDQKGVAHLWATKSSNLVEGTNVAAVKDIDFKKDSALELGELRDMVADEGLRTKETSRNEVMKWRESSYLSSRQPSNKAHISPEKDKPQSLAKQGVDVKKASAADVRKQQVAKKDLQKVEVSSSLRETGRLGVGAPKFGAGQDDKLETANNRMVDGTKIRAGFGDTIEKALDGRSGKRQAEEGGIYDPGRPSKRLAVDVSQAAALLGHEEADISFDKQEKLRGTFDNTGKTSAFDMAKGMSLENWNQPAANSSKGMGDNGQVFGPKSKRNDGIDKDVADRRGPMLDSKQRIAAGLLGPGTKREIQICRKKSSTQTGDVQSQEFFAPYERKVAQLKGPISQYDQYLEYRKEYNDKYPVYVRLNTVLESDKEDFESFSRDISMAKSSDDKNRLGIIYGKVRNDYLHCNKRFRRMQKTFTVLHDELKAIKQRCKDYAEKLGQG